MVRFDPHTSEPRRRLHANGAELVQGLGEPKSPDVQGRARIEAARGRNCTAGIRTSARERDERWSGVSQLASGEQLGSGGEGLRFHCTELPNILAKRSYVLSLRVMRIIEGLAGRLASIRRAHRRSVHRHQSLGQDPACERLMSVPGAGPIISSAMVGAIGNGAASDMANLPRSRCLKKPEIIGCAFSENQDWKMAHLLCVATLQLFNKFCVTCGR
jgi:hypothetical protein